MTRPKIRPSTVLGLTAALVLSWTPDARPEESPRMQQRAGGVSWTETPDDPPAADNPRQNPEARSPSFAVVFGPYLSHQVNVDGLQRNIVGDAANEPSIAVSPTDPDNMVIGWRQFDSIASNFRQAGVGRTLSGGTVWTFPGPLDPGVFRSDPVLDFDTAGNFYYQSLRVVNNTLEVFVYKSTDGGLSWSTPVASFGGDKNWMAVDRSGGLGDGHIYGIWQRFGGACCGADVLTRSIDGNVSYQTPVPVALSPTFGTMAVGPDGALYAAGIDGTVTQDLNTFVVSRSLNAQDPVAGPTFAGVEVPLGGSMGFGSGPNPGGLLGQAIVAVDHSPGPTHGNVYLLSSVVPSAGSDPVDVHFARSTDDGQTWSPFVRVNDDASSSNWQWFGTMSVAPNGRIDVVWNDTRNSGMANVSQLFYSYSYDAGVTWSTNVPVSPSFDSFLGWPQQNKMGDYYDMVSNETGADVAYAATFNGEQDVYYINVFPDCNTNGISDETDVADATSPDCDANRIPDECQTPAGAGSVPDGALVPGTPLSVERAGADIELTWGSSCSVGDVDYVIYEGILGSFAMHDARFCGTGGQTMQSFTPADGDTYYLVAPTTTTVEGSLGRDSNGNQRPQGQTICLPRQILDCCLLP